MDIVITAEAVQAIGWFYAATSVLRVVAYAPQVWLVWRCVEGARSVSMITWITSAVSHLAATIYGLGVVYDFCFVAVGVGNFVGSVAVVWVACAQRGASRRRSACPACPPPASTARKVPLAVVPRQAAADPNRPANPPTTPGTAVHWQFRALPEAA